VHSGLDVICLRCSCRKKYKELDPKSVGEEAARGVGGNAEKQFSLSARFHCEISAIQNVADAEPIC